jgi:hypothetical protein
MLLSEWGSEAPSSGCMSQAVLDVLGPVLFDMGAGDDPECWVAWGDDPEFKYSVLAPTAAGLVAVAVRLNPGGEGGPRATAKLVRWSKLQLGEFAIEAADGHRVVAVQVEGLVLKGTDDVAARICEFVRGLMAGADGRAFAASGPMVVQAVPVSAAAGRAKAAARPGKVATPPAAAAAPAARGGRKGGKAAKPEPEPEPEVEFVAPHPIPVSDEPAAAPKPAPTEPAPVPPPRPAQPVPQPAPHPPAPAPGFGPAQPRPPMREPGSVWEIPAGDPAGREQKKPRTWRP